MISLFFIGNFVEKIIGRKRYLGVCIASGIFASIFYAVLSYFFGNGLIGARIFGDPLIPSLGASGAIFAIAGLLAVLTPKLRVYLIVGPIIAIIIQAALSPFIEGPIMQIINLIVYIYIFVSIFTIFSFNPTMRKLALPLGMPFWILPVIAIVPLIIVGLFVTLPIGNMAHLGGLLAGIIYGGYLQKRYPRKVNSIRNFFSTKRFTRQE
jgi:membrane associated rhomboid family serine protease